MKERLNDEQYLRLAEFRRQLRSFLAFSKGAVAKAGLAPQQYQALLAIRARQPEGRYTIGALAEELFIRPNTAVELVNRLERAGLVFRQSEPGGRVSLNLTDEGCDALAALAEVHLGELERIGPALQRIWR